MAFPTFVPPKNGKFAHGATEDHQPRVLSAQLGDGYMVEAGDGLNNDAAVLNVSWNVNTWAEGQAIMDFFKDRKGYLPFKFTLPGESTPRKFKCKKWTRTWATNKTVDVSASWTEVFDPE